MSIIVGDSDTIWWMGPFPRILHIFNGKYHGLYSDYLRLGHCQDHSSGSIKNAPFIRYSH